MRLDRWCWLKCLSYSCFDSCSGAVSIKMNVLLYAPPLLLLMLKVLPFDFCSIKYMPKFFSKNLISNLLLLLFFFFPFPFSFPFFILFNYFFTSFTGYGYYWSDICFSWCCTSTGAYLICLCYQESNFSRIFSFICSNNRFNIMKLMSIWFTECTSI